MSLNTLEEIASYIVSEGKGILAADESNPTCGKRFDSIGVESNEDNRRDYREMLFRSSGMKENIGGVILFDETIRQHAKDGTSLERGSVFGMLSNSFIKKNYATDIFFHARRSKQHFSVIPSIILIRLNSNAIESFAACWIALISSKDTFAL